MERGGRHSTAYGTLIDWNGGIGRELERLFGADARRRAALRRYHELEPRDPARGSEPQLPRGDGASRSPGSALPADEHDALGRSLPEWEPFPRCRRRSRRCASRGWRLAMLSNTDRDLIDASVARIGVEFDLTVVASEIGSYKPAPAHWDEFFARTGADRDGHVHVAASLFHDIAPARRSACGPSGSTGSARRPSRSPTSSCKAWTVSRTPSTSSCRERSARSSRTTAGNRRAVRSREDRAAGRPRASTRPTSLGVAQPPARDEHVALRGGVGSSQRRAGALPRRPEDRRVAVRPRVQGRGLGTQIVALAEAPLARRAPKDPHVGARGRRHARGGTSTSRGYEEVRRFWDMAIDSTRARPSARTSRSRLSAETSGRLSRRARGGVRRPLGARTRSRSTSGGAATGAPEFRPALWFLIRDEDEIAAVAATRRPGRRRLRRGARRAASRGRPGLRQGAAPTARFREFQRRGLPRVTLGVDADEPAGATQLYERSACTSSGDRSSTRSARVNLRPYRRPTREHSATSIGTRSCATGFWPATRNARPESPRQRRRRVGEGERMDLEEDMV